MKKVVKSALFLALLSPMLASCSSNSSTTEGTILRVLNSEDYIYVNAPDDGYDEPDLIDQFSEWVASDPELAAKYGKVTVVYDTADTMENIYSEMQTGKTNYDLICASDYIVAKMARYGLIKPIDKDLIPNYFGYYDEETEEEVPAMASALLSERLNGITTTPIQGKYKGVEQSLGDYAVGYMWGTLGILFNPTYDKYISEFNGALSKGDIDEDEYESLIEEFTEKMIEDMSSFDALWNDNSLETEADYSPYKGTMSIKDSMRDTFAFGIMHAYRDIYKDKDGNEHPGFEPLREQYYGGDLSLEEYNEEFSKLFNYVVSDESNPQQVIDDVVADLEVLKKNVFGLEVDSGKQDIVTGKIGINMAWSGDAVYSMDQAEDPEQVGENIHELYYSVPKTGSNLWMDVWVMPDLPKAKQSEEQVELAHLFLDYLSNPEIAAKNMDYTGYTSFIAGDDILELVRDWYDSRCDEVYFYDEEEDEYYDVVAVDDSISEPTSEDLDEGHFIWFEDCLSTSHDSSIDGYNLFYVTSYKENPDYDPEDEESVELLVDTFEPWMLIDEETGEVTDIQKTYGDIYMYDLDEDELYDHIDLSYIFKGTLSDYYTEEDMVFYSDDYAYYIIESEVEDGIDEICVGRQFYTQYPDKETINRCAVMKDYEQYNDAIMKMWENFKSEPLPVWAIVIFALMLAGIVGGVIYYFVAKKVKVKLRNIRISEK